MLQIRFLSLTQKEGALVWANLVTKETKTVQTLDVRTASEQGLLSVAIHPRFTQNGLVYLHRTPKDGHDLQRLQNTNTMSNNIRSNELGFFFMLNNHFPITMVVQSDSVQMVICMSDLETGMAKIQRQTGNSQFTTRRDSPIEWILKASFLQTIHLLGCKISP